jgi:type IX secretion system PorP/SprF family membrane protein
VWAMVISLSSFAQDYNRLPIHVSYPFNGLAINPAYAGSREVTSLTALLRQQSLFQQGMPSSQYFSIDTPIMQEKGGLGFQAFNDNYSATSIGFLGSFAYRSFVGENGVLSYGIQGGTVQMRTGTNMLSTNEFMFTYGGGIYYNDFLKYVGISVPVFNTLQPTGGMALPRPIFLTAGYVYEVHDDLAIKGSMLARQYMSSGSSASSSTALDFGATVWLKRKYGIGGWYQGTGSEVNPSKAMLLTLEIQSNDKLRFGAAYDFMGDNGLNTQTTNPLTGGVGSSGKGLFYMMLRYEFDNGNGKVSDFRYF